MQARRKEPAAEPGKSDERYTTSVENSTHTNGHVPLVETSGRPRAERKRDTAGGMTKDAPRAARVGARGLHGARDVRRRRRGKRLRGTRFASGRYFRGLRTISLLKQEGDGLGLGRVAGQLPRLLGRRGGAGLRIRVRLFVLG